MLLYLENGLTPTPLYFQENFEFKFEFQFQVRSDFRDPFRLRNGTRYVTRIDYRTPVCKPETSFSGTLVVPNNGIRILPSAKIVSTWTFSLQSLSKRFETKILVNTILIISSNDEFYNMFFSASDFTLGPLNDEYVKNLSTLNFHAWTE